MRAPTPNPGGVRRDPSFRGGFGEEVFEVRETHPISRSSPPPLMGPLYMEAFQAGDLHLALAICGRAQGMPEDVGPLFSLGRVYRARGETEDAIRAYVSVLGFAPDHPAAENARTAIAELGGRRLGELKKPPTGL